MRERARTAFLLLVATVMGGLVMAIEVLGTRLVGTLYGTSLYVWGALISVTLVALACGYFAGGLLADWRPRAWVLYLALALGGVATIAAPHLRVVMLPLYRALGLRWGALASAAALFFLPLFALGMTGPFVIRLLSRRVERSGLTAGMVYALSTIGSVAGTLAVAFYLVPVVGTPLTLRVVGAVVVLVSGVGLALERGAAWGVVAVAALGGLVGGTPRKDQRLELRDARGNPFAIIYRDESAYARLAVIETQDARMLLADGILQTGVPWGHYELEKARLLVEQGYYLELLPYLVPRPEGKRALVIGLAGGLLPRLLALHGIECLAVEIDPKMVEVARRFFGYRGRAVVCDGRRFIEDCTERFDFVVLDAYSGDVLPFHLVTREMFQAVARRLVPGGIVAMNLIVDPDGEAAASVFRTLEAVFPVVWAYRSRDDSGVQPIFYFASSREPPLSRRWMLDFPPEDGVASLPYKLHQRRFRPPEGRGSVLTDAHNAVDLARAPEALAWRQHTIEELGLDALDY